MYFGSILFTNYINKLALNKTPFLADETSSLWREIRAMLKTEIRALNWKEIQHKALRWAFSRKKITLEHSPISVEMENEIFHYFVKKTECKT